MVGIGVVGLGRMGAALFRELRARDFPVVGHDVAEQARRAVATVGPTSGSLAELAAASDVVFTSLPDEESVEQVATELVGWSTRRYTIVETSTCGPPLGRRLAERAHQGGHSFVDAPVSGRAPRSTAYVGAVEGTLGAARAPLEAVSETVVYCGSPGQGYALKLLQQFVKYSRFLAAGEAIRAAESMGVERRVAVAGLLAGSGAAPGLATAEEAAVGPDARVDRHAPTSTIAKDVDLVRRMLAQQDVDCPSFDALEVFFRAAADSPLADLPYPRSLALLETGTSS